MTKKKYIVYDIYQKHPDGGFRFREVQGTRKSAIAEAERLRNGVVDTQGEHYKTQWYFRPRMSKYSTPSYSTKKKRILKNKPKDSIPIFKDVYKKKNMLKN